MAGSIGSMLADPAYRILNRLQQSVEDVIKAVPVVGTVYSSAKSEFQQATSTGAFSKGVPLANLYNQNSLDPMLQTIGNNADKASNNLNKLQAELENAGENPPPGLLAKIQIATSIYNTWMSALTNMADAKKKAPEEIARNLRG